MNNEEPIQNITLNSPVQSHKLKEQGTVSSYCVPRPVSILSLMYQWQPMGIRIILDLPFTGNDSSSIFVVRNGPFIPRWDKDYEDTSNSHTSPLITWSGYKFKNYAWNNTRNVFHGAIADYDYPIKITQYDYPPILSSLSQCFRRWRGDMQYRIRVVAGFATQGYIIIRPIKNYFSPIGVYNEYNKPVGISEKDDSFRDGMINSYILADTSMFRHVELTYPYEYPAPYYDQYAWLSRRVSPLGTATQGTRKQATDPFTYDPQTYILNEPHGDNWFAVSLRGNLSASAAGSQVIFELEYRACEGFQFADPGLPLQDMALPYAIVKGEIKGHEIRSNYPPLKIIPSSTRQSDGLGTESAISEKVTDYYLEAKQKLNTLEHTYKTHFENRTYQENEALINRILLLRDEITKIPGHTKDDETKAKKETI